MSNARRSLNPTRDNDSRGQLVVRAAKERFNVALADGPATPNWYDLVLAQPGHDTIGLAAPIKARAAIDRMPSDPQRRGRWTFRRPTHERLLAVNGYYALGVYDETGAVQRLSLVPASDVATHVDGNWTETPDCDSAQVSWGTVFNDLSPSDDVDHGRGPIPDGAGAQQPSVTGAAPIDPTPRSDEPAPVELVVDPSNSDAALVIEVIRHLRTEFDLETKIDREHALVYEIDADDRGRSE